MPTVINGVKCVVVNSELREAEPMAWDFAINFAKDNDLQMAEACLLPDQPPAEHAADMVDVAGATGEAILANWFDTQYRLDRGAQDRIFDVRHRAYPCPAACRAASTVSISSSGTA